jgi:putative ABC transport system ATP-binding protein
MFIQVQSLCKQYQVSQPAVLQNLSFTVPQGAFVALMGPSGCGKSTLLHLLGALDVPTSGTVQLGDTIISAFTAEQLTIFRQRHLGFVFQFFNLLPTLTVLENVTLPLLLNGITGQQAKQLALEWLEKVGLLHRATALPSQLSGGEQQRVAVVRALIHQPQLVLADEPTGNLDSVSGQAVMRILRQLASEQGTTIVMATHSEELALQTDTILRLKDGVLCS